MKYNTNQPFTQSVTMVSIDLKNITRTWLPGNSSLNVNFVCPVCPVDHGDLGEHDCHGDRDDHDDHVDQKTSCSFGEMEDAKQSIWRL